MYIDNIINGVSFLLFFIVIVEYIVVSNTNMDWSYKAMRIITKIFKVAVYLGITTIIFLVSFFKIKYLGNVVLIGLIGGVLLIYNIVDVFYFQTLKDDYIYMLQKQLCSEDNFNILFDVVECNGAKYNYEKDDKRKKYGITTDAKGDRCIGGDDKYLLKPKKQMSDKLLHFYCTCLEMEIDVFPLFKNEYEFEEYLSSYIFLKPNKLFYKVKSKRKLIAKVLLISVFVIAFLYFLFLFLDHEGYISFFDWMSIEVN